MPSALSFTYAILDRVHCDIKESPTQWRIVYDPRRLEIHFLTLENPQRRMVRFRDFSLNCGDNPNVLDLQSTGAGDVGKNFVAYSNIVNDELMRKTFAIYKQAGFQKDMPDIYLAVLAAYPNMLKCQ